MPRVPDRAGAKDTLVPLLPSSMAFFRFTMGEERGSGLKIFLVMHALTKRHATNSLAMEVETFLIGFSFSSF